MSETQGAFRSVKGSLTIESLGGALVLTFDGARPPQTLAEIPDYVAACIRKSIVGLSDLEADKLRARVSELQATVDAKIAEIRALRDEMKRPRSKRAIENV